MKGRVGLSGTLRPLRVMVMETMETPAHGFEGSGSALSSGRRPSRIMGLRAAPEKGWEVVPEGRVGLGDAAWIADGNVRAAEGDQGQGHRHPVVVVGVEDDGRGFSGETG